MYKLRLAVRRGDLKEVDEFLKQEEVINNVKELTSILQIAVQEERVDVVNRLLELDIVRKNAAANDNEALRLAAQKGYSVIVDKLLEIDAVRKDAAVNWNQALWVAASHGHVAVVKSLLKIEAVREKAGILGNQILWDVASKGYVDVVDCLLMVDIVKQSYRQDGFYGALEQAVSNGHVAVVDSFFKIEAVREDERERRGHYNPCLRLKFSILNYQPQVVEYLLEIPGVSSEVEVTLRRILDPAHTPRVMFPNILMLAELCTEKGILLPSGVYIKVDEKQESVEALQKSLTFLKTIAGYFVWDLQKIILEYSDLPSSIALKQQQYKQSAPKNPPVSSLSIQCKQQLSSTSTLEGQIGSAPPILHSYTSVQQKSTEKPIEKLLSCINQLTLQTRDSEAMVSSCR